MGFAEDVDNDDKSIGCPQDSCGGGASGSGVHTLGAVRIEVTIRDRQAGEHDVAITAPPGSTLGQLRAQLNGLLEDSDSQDTLYNGYQRLAATAPLGAPELADGAVLAMSPPVGRALVETSVLHLHVAGGPDAGHMIALAPGELRIGRDAGCELALADPDISRRHAALTVSPGRITIRDLGSTNGTFVDGEAVTTGERQLAPGSLVQLGNTALTVVESVESPAAQRPGEDGGIWVNRGPRTVDDPELSEIALPHKPTRSHVQRVQWIAALLPAALGVALALIMHMPEFLLFGLLSGVMLVGSALGERVHWRRQRRREAASYRSQLRRTQQQIAQAMQREALHRRHAEPDPAALLLIASTPGARIWERRREDADLLRVRLGLATLPATLQVSDEGARRSAGELRAVPAGTDLRAGPLGIAAPEEVAASIARWAVCQLATLASPIDLGFALLLSPSAAARWRWARWLPHLDGRVATTPDEAAHLIAELRAELERRTGGTGHSGRWNGPWLVIVIDRAGPLSEVPGLIEVLRRGRSVGVTAICLDEREAQLPSACVSGARVAGETGTHLDSRTGTEPGCRLRADRVSPRWAETVSRALAPLRDRSTGSGGLPEHCRLIDLLDARGGNPEHVASRWAVSDGQPATVLGLGADGPVTIDLARDGPHALVAGTTGSGKSELLQTLVAGLAATHPPEQISFVLIDYKGGAAFADCARLPHTAGIVTDLDAQLTARALQSLECELRRREELFARAAAKDLDEYRSRTDNEPVARLMLVVDEFAALAEELPEFLTGLIGIAQRGRSLGVHLVLATQRPSGAVSPEIRANAALRIALRMTDPGESADVIDAPLAASIAPGTPGRAFIRSGTAIAEVQSARVGAPAPREPRAVTVEPLDQWRRSYRGGGEREDGAVTDLALLVNTLQTAASASGRRSAPPPWLPPLPDLLAASSLDAAAHECTIALGLVDLPAQQRQQPFTVDLAAARSLLLAGGARCGRSSALVNLALAGARALSPDELHVYGIDFDGDGLAPLSSLAHCATLATADNAAHTAGTLLRRLDQEVSRRAAQLSEAGFSSAAEARAAGHRLPLLLCVLDGWDTFAATFAETDGGRSVELLLALLRAGPAAGLTIALAGDRAALAPRLAGAVHTKLVLRMTERADYGLAGIPPRAVPGSLPPGRAVRADDVAEIQLAHRGASPTRAEQVRVAKQLSDTWARTGAPQQVHPPPIRIRPLPTSVRLNALPQRPGLITLGVGGDAAAPICIDPFAGSARMLVAGPARSGRSSALATILLQCARAASSATEVPATEVIVACSPRSPLLALARQLSVRVLGPDCPADSLTDSLADGAIEPDRRTLLVVDDCEAFTDTGLDEAMSAWARSAAAGLAVVVAGRSDELAVSYRGIGTQVRRSRCGVLLCPAPVDGALLGVHLPRSRQTHPPGRGIVIGDPAWALSTDGEPVHVQIAHG